MDAEKKMNSRWWNCILWYDLYKVFGNVSDDHLSYFFSNGNFKLSKKNDDLPWLWMAGMGIHLIGIEIRMDFYSEMYLNVIFKYEWIFNWFKISIRFQIGNSFKFKFSFHQSKFFSFPGHLVQLKISWLRQVFQRNYF